MSAVSPPCDRPAAAAARAGRASARGTRRARAVRIARRLTAALLAACALPAACGPDAPDAPPRYAVVERHLRLEPRAADAAPARFSRAFQPAVDGTWAFDDPSVARSEGELLLARGRGRLTLSGPADGGVDPALQHHLRLRVRGRQLRGVHLWWRRADEAWSESRSSQPIPVEFTGDWQVLQFDLESMRGRRDRDVSEGVDQFRVRFLPEEPGGEVELDIDGIELVSDFDAAGTEPQRLVHLGTGALGWPVAAGESVALALEPGPRDRLRFAVAAAGSPVELEVADDEGRLAPLRVRVEPGEEWRELKLDLAPLDARPARLEFRVTGEGRRPGLALLGALLRLAPETEPAPDLLLYLEDTLRADHLGTYGYAFDTDPFLRALAAQGVVLERTFAASSWTRPAVSTLLSSLNPTRHGNRTHVNRLPDEALTLAEHLAAQGWVTRSFVTNYHGGAWAGLDQGFDLAGDALAYGASNLESTLTSALVEDPLADFLREHADERVFVHVHTLDPHSPYDAPAALRAPFQRRRLEREPFAGPSAHRHMDDAVNYDAEILHNDGRLERLDAVLAETGRRDHTLFVFLSDHGEAWDEHGHFEHRESLFQEEVHVPWVLRWPAGLPAGRRLAAPVGHVDVAPTLAGLLGAPVPAAWQGRDLSDWLAGDAPAPPRADEPLLLDLLYETRREERLGQLAVVKDHVKLVFDLLADDELRPRALYDLDSDPGETTNLLAHPDWSRAADALGEWARRAVAADRALRTEATASPMSEAQRRALQELGYLQGDDDG